MRMTRKYELSLCFSWMNSLFIWTLKKLLADWSLNIGEQCLKLETVCRDYKVYDFLALTEEALYVIT